MPCIWGEHDGNQVFVDVHILSLEDSERFPAGMSGKTPQVFKALVDTGASLTCLTKNVVGSVGLEPVGKVPISGVSGQTFHHAYLFHVAFTVKAEGRNIAETHLVGSAVQGAEFIAPRGDFDVLLGMDILSVGSLAVEGNGTYSFSF